MAQSTYRSVKGGDVDYGAATFTGTMSGQKRAVVIKTASYTLTAADSGKIIVANAATTLVFTLPATVLGLEFTIFVLQPPGSGVGTSLSPAAADKLIGNGFTAADDKDAINTAATDAVGDKITVVGDGVDGWYITSVVGTWARE